METSVIKILDTLELGLSDIHNSLSLEEWFELRNQLFLIHNYLDIETTNDKGEIAAKKIVDMFSHYRYIKNFIVEQRNGETVRGPVSPVQQQPDMLTEHLLCQRISDFISSMDNLDKQDKERNRNEQSERSHTL